MKVTKYKIMHKTETVYDLIDDFGLLDKEWALESARSQNYLRSKHNLNLVEVRAIHIELGEVVE